MVATVVSLRPFEVLWLPRCVHLRFRVFWRYKLPPFVSWFSIADVMTVTSLVIGGEGMGEKAWISPMKEYHIGRQAYANQILRMSSIVTFSVRRGQRHCTYIFWKSLVLAAQTPRQAATTGTLCF